MPRQKKIKEGIRVSVVLPEEQLELVRQMAIRMSVEHKRQITLSEAIRMAVEAVYPLPNSQMKLFAK